MVGQRSGAGRRLALGWLVAVSLLVSGCSSGASKGAADRGTASPSGSASGSASAGAAPSIAASAQPTSVPEVLALFAAVPGGTPEAPAFDRDVAADVDKALGTVVKRSSAKAYFATVERGRPRGVIVAQYLICPLAFGKDLCGATVEDYRRVMADCGTGGGVRVERKVGSGTAWAAAGACVRKVTSAMEKDAVAEVYAVHRDAGAKVRKDAALASVARDWAKQRLSEPRESISKIDTPRERQLYRRLGLLARGRTGCFDRRLTEPIGLDEERAVRFLPDGGTAGVNGRRVRLGAGVARDRGTLVVVFCEDIR